MAEGIVTGAEEEALFSTKPLEVLGIGESPASMLRDVFRRARASFFGGFVLLSTVAVDIDAAGGLCRRCNDGVFEDSSLAATGSDFFSEAAA